MSHKNTIIIVALSSLIGTLLSQAAKAVTIPITNENFENPLLSETGSPNPIFSGSNVVPGWIATSSGSFQSLYDPDFQRLEAAGVDNNWLYQGFAGSASAKQ